MRQSQHERMVREFLEQAKQDDPARYKAVMKQTPSKRDATLERITKPPVGAPRETTVDPQGAAALAETGRDADEYEPDSRDLVAGYDRPDAGDDDEEEGDGPVLYRGQWVYQTIEFNSRGDVTRIVRVPAPPPKGEAAVPRIPTVAEQLEARIAESSRAQERQEWAQTEQGRLWGMRSQGMTYKQIGEATGKPLGTVKATLNQARKTMERRGV